MRISTRARVAFLLSIATLVVVALAGSQLASAGSPNEGGGGSSGSSGVDDGVVPGCGDAGEPGATGCSDTGKVPTQLGCGERTSGNGPDTVVSYTPCPGDDQPAPGDGATLVVPTPGMAGVRIHPFDHAVAGHDGSKVTVYFWSGVEPCYVLDHVDVAYGSASVAITLYEGHDPDAGDVACIEIALLKKVVVQLDEPLAGRDIADGAAEK